MTTPAAPIPPQDRLTRAVQGGDAGTAPADVAGDASTKAQLAIGTSVQGAVDTFGDHDWYRVTLDGLTQYQFTLAAAESNAGTLRMGSSGVYEEYIHLLDPQGAYDITWVGWSVSTQQGQRAIVFAPTRAGDYYLDVGSSYLTGSYTLSAKVLARDDHANDIAHATPLPLNGKLDGAINYTDDVDQFSVTLRAGVSYTVTLDSGGMAYGTVLRSLAQSGGPSARVSGDGSRWEGVNTLSLVPSQDGVYYIKAAGGSGDSVPYHVTLAEAKDDYLASTATSGRALPGVLARGTLESHADADWFKVAVTAGQSYLLQALTATGETPDINVFDATGKQLMVTYDGSTVKGTDALLWRAPASGDYYVQVSDTFVQGAYTLLATPAPADDFGDTKEWAGLMVPGLNVRGTLETPGDVDWFKVPVTAGSDYVFKIDARNALNTQQANAQLQLINSFGIEVATSSSSATELVFHATRTGDHFLAVSDPSYRHTGGYTVTMQASSSDTLSANTRTTGTLAPGGLILGNIDYSTDTDWVRVDLKAQNSYHFELTGALGRGGTLPANTLSLSLVNEDGRTVATQNYQYGKDPTVGYSVSTDGTYYLVISASTGVTGSYTLKASDNDTLYVDTLPPLLTGSALPVGARVLEKDSSLIVYFDEAVQLGTGAITLRQASGELVESFSAAAGNASLPAHYSSLSLNPKPLEYATDYVLTLAPGSITDTSSHAFEGGTLTFRTADAPPRQDGRAGNDVFYGRKGDEVIDGKGGRDSVTFKGAAAAYTVSQQDGAIKVDARAGGQGHDTLVSIERVLFDDMAIAYDTDGSAGKAFRLYQSAFDRAPDLDGLGYWIAQFDRGATLNAVAGGFIHSAEYTARYGANSSDNDFVTALYSNVLHRLPDQGGADYWNARLHDGADRAEVLVAFSESPENQAALIGQISKGMVYHLYS